MDSDALGDLLRALRLRARIDLHAHFCADWAVDTSGAKQASFHVIAHGSCWMHTPAADSPVPLASGDMVVFPHDAPHVLRPSSIPSGYGTKLNHPMHAPPEGAYTTLICGHFDFGQHVWNPLLDAMPPMLIMRGGTGEDSALSDSLLSLMVGEARDGSIGSSVVLDKLAETLFVHVLRAHLRESPVPRGFLAALADRALGKALHAIHQSPDTRWTVCDLARCGGMSRSAFAERFQRLVGMPPMHYIAAWHMQRAMDMLASIEISVAQVAASCGYETEAAFAKAFKRHFGMGPGAVRREHGCSVPSIRSSVSAND
ncbi:MAG: AraC family transcriptional regulator [Thiobacillus sp.]|nr:AraC family transcriptional regulator [Thiobacillus sp.]